MPDILAIIALIVSLTVAFTALGIGLTIGNRDYHREMEEENNA